VPICVDRQEDPVALVVEDEASALKAANATVDKATAKECGDRKDEGSKVLWRRRVKATEAARSNMEARPVIRPHAGVSLEFS
jgi:hypothetical protein